MSSSFVWRALVVLVVLAGATFMVFTEPVRLGLDLRGGTQIVLELQDTEQQEVDDDTAERTLEVLRRRVDALGVAEPTLQRQGTRRIIVELPGVTDPEEAENVIGRTAQLAFHPVLGLALDPGDPGSEAPGSEPDVPAGGEDAPGGEEAPTDPELAPGEEPAGGDAAGRPVATLASLVLDSAQEAPAGEPEPVEDADPDVPEPSPDDRGEERILPDDTGMPIRLGPAALTGDHVASAAARFDDLGGGWRVDIDFRGEGGTLWAQLTGEAACAPPGEPQRRVAIVLDDDVISSPQVAVDVQCGVGITGGSTVITGNFTQAEAQELALLIRAGALPVPVETIAQSTVGPTLGETAIANSIRAVILGGILTIVFLLAYYRFLGLVAALALGAYGVIAYAVLLGLDAVLTLPGIAGFVLAIGMAVDGNILVFERAKEEHATGRQVRPSMLAGFQRAFSAIADSNITTLIAAATLFFFATGAVRGFGVTLSIGVVVSMFSTLVVTRVLIEIAVRIGAIRNRPALVGMKVGHRFRRLLAERRPDIVGRSKLWFAVSGLLLVLAVVGMFARGFNWGIEFTGGNLFEYAVTEPVDIDELRSDIAALGFPRAVIQDTGVDEQGRQRVTIRTPELSEGDAERIQDAVRSHGGQLETLQDEFVGPTIGQELRQRALIALFIALGAQLLYMAIRFRWTYGTGAVLAMFHDVVILIGLFAWMGKLIDGVFVAALLTVIGYSVNDTVVVFDRVREERLKRIRDPLAEVANDAALETLPRTVNTGLSTLFILVTLFMLGGETLTDFALALIVGIVVGTYSSVFAASPVAVALESRWPAPVRHASGSVSRQPATAGGARKRAGAARGTGAGRQPIKPGSGKKR